MRGRSVPVVNMSAHLPDDPSVMPDTRYFLSHPEINRFERAYVPGETIEPMPLGTRVIVQRIGKDRRARAFVPPQEGLN
jgi:hypothetical protein